MNLYNKLYLTLSIEFNFDSLISDPNDIKWQGWIEDLIQYEPVLLAVIGRIKKGELLKVMKHSQIFPTLSDVKQLCRNEKRLLTLDSKTQDTYNAKQLGFERKCNKEVINRLISECKEKPKGSYDNFDTERFEKEGYKYLDYYISLKSGVR